MRKQNTTMIHKFILFILGFYLAQSSQSRRKEILVLSLDYDGCADILLEDSLQSKMYDLAHSDLKEDFALHRKTLNDILRYEIARHDDFVVMVGSARQSDDVERINRETNVAETEEKFVKMGKPICVKYDPNKEGFARYDLQRYAGERNFDRVRFPGTMLNSNGRKDELIMAQMKHIHEHYPREHNYTLLFLDDDPHKCLLEEVIDTWTHRYMMGNLPDNVHLRVAKFDYFDAITNKKAAYEDLSTYMYGKLFPPGSSSGANSTAAAPSATSSAADSSASVASSPASSKPRKLKNKKI